MKWFCIGFYHYLFSDLSWTDGTLHSLKVIICRINGHKKGPVWFNAGGFEPDMSCKNCGDQL